MDLEKIEDIIEKRAGIIIWTIQKDIDIRDTEFYIAGNSLNGLQRSTDVDIFPSDTKNNDKLLELFKDYEIYRTKNAVTYSLKGKIIQICNYIFPTLKELVYSFDYSHIQVGARIEDCAVLEVCFTDEYIESRIIGNTEYLGSNYPLSSLIRAFKYKEHKEISKGRMIYSILSALADIVERGFKDYADFKDQLDAVDLGLLPEDFEEFMGREDKLKKLFELLERK